MEVEKRTKANPVELTALNDHGETALHQAVKYGQLEMIELLLKLGSDPDAAAAGSGSTPLHYAVMRGNVKAVRMLIRGGADPLVVDAGGHDAIDEAENHVYAHVEEVLRELKKGVSVEGGSPGGVAR